MNNCSNFAFLAWKRTHRIVYTFSTLFSFLSLFLFLVRFCLFRYQNDSNDWQAGRQAVHFFLALLLLSLLLLLLQKRMKIFETFLDEMLHELMHTNTQQSSISNGVYIMVKKCHRNWLNMVKKSDHWRMNWCRVNRIFSLTPIVQSITKREKKMET